jgi:diamine N-acetyltransferase
VIAIEVTTGRERNGVAAAVSYGRRVAGKEVTLREITAETVRAVCALEVGPEQHGYVAPNAVSIAQAHFEPKAWFRAVYADETPVGFVMLHQDPEEGAYFLWRFVIAAEHQGAGYGKTCPRPRRCARPRAAGREGAPLELRARRGSAGRVLPPLRLAETGEADGGEVVLRLELEPDRAFG